MFFFINLHKDWKTLKKLIMTHTVSTLNIGRIKRIKQLRYQVHINLSLWAHSVTTLYKKFPLLGWIPFKTTKHFRSSDQHNN